MSGSIRGWLGGTINAARPADWVLASSPGAGTGIPSPVDGVINNGTMVGFGVTIAALANNCTAPCLLRCDTTRDLFRLTADGPGATAGAFVQAAKSRRQASEDHFLSRIAVFPFSRSEP